MVDGVAGMWGTPDLAYATGRYSCPMEGGANKIAEYTVHPDAQTEYFTPGFELTYPASIMVSTNAQNGFYNYVDGAYAQSAWTNDPDLTQTWGYNFFEHNGKDYIAYVKVNTDRAAGSLNIIEDVNGAADFQGTLEAKTGLETFAIPGTGNAGHGVGDCSVAVTENATYVAAMIQNIGLAVYKLN